MAALVKGKVEIWNPRAVNGQLMAEVFTVDAGDQANVSVLPDLLQDLEIAFSALQIAVLVNRV